MKLQQLAGTRVHRGVGHDVEEPGVEIREDEGQCTRVVIYFHAVVLEILYAVDKPDKPLFHHLVFLAVLTTNRFYPLLDLL